MDRHQLLRFMGTQLLRGRGGWSKASPSKGSAGAVEGGECGLACPSGCVSLAGWTKERG